MRYWTVITVALLGLMPAVAHAVPEIRFCPSAQVRTYPQEDRRGVQGLLLQNVAIVNRDTGPFRVNTITIELLQRGVVTDQRIVSGADLQKTADRGKKVDAAGMIPLVPFQFCGRDLIHEGESLGGPVLAHNQAMLVMQQAFAYNGARDLVRIRVDGEESGQKVNAGGELPINPGFSKTHFIFPLRGVWLAGNGPSFHTSHRWAVPEEFAFDIARIGANGLSHSGSGVRFSDYYAYGADVLAAADGRVIRVHDGEPEDAKAMQQPGETQQAYFARLLQDQGARLAKGVDGVAGNFVMIDHGNGEYSLYAHLKPASVTVKQGDKILAGRPVGKLGSSGNSTEPHLHFQVCDRPDPLMCVGIPVDFTNVTVFWSDLPRPVQSGDIVIAN